MIRGVGSAAKVEPLSDSHQSKPSGAGGFVGLLGAPLCLEAWLALLVPAEEARFAAWVVSGIVVIFYFPPEVSGSCGRITIPEKFGGHYPQL